MSLRRPTSPEELNLILWTLIIVLLAMGIVGVTLSYSPNILNDQTAQLARVRSFFALFVAGLIYGIKHFLERISL